MKKVKGNLWRDVLSMMLLRSMQQALFRAQPWAALVAEFLYSPTVRFAGIQDSISPPYGARVWKDLEVAKGHFEQVIPDTASQSSSRERRVADAERRSSQK